MSKYVDVDVFIKGFREVLLGLKARVDLDLTPKAYAYLRGGEAMIEDLTKFTAADVVEVADAGSVFAIFLWMIILGNVYS